MGTLVKFELKKLFNKKMNIIVIIVCLFLITLLFSMAGKDFLATDKSGKFYKGKEAISVRKEQMKEVSGTLTNEKIIKEIEKLQLERILEIEQIVDEDGTTIKLKILRGEN